MNRELWGDVSLWCVSIFCQYHPGYSFFQRLALPEHNDSCGRLCGANSCFLFWHVCIKSGLNTKAIPKVYTHFPVSFIKSTISINLICILDRRGLYSVSQELLKGKKETQELLDSLIS